jgi:hypothetical protein
MSSELEGVLFFGVMALVFITTITFTRIKMIKTKNYKSTLLQSVCLGSFLFSLASLWWFFQASDGFSQVFGGLIYGLGFILSCVLNTAILCYLKKKLT